jgi:uncharacterized protein (TIGR03437 family)
MGGARSTPPAVSAIVNAAGDSALTSVAPGSLITLFGANLAMLSTSLNGWQGTRVPISLNGMEVTIGGRRAPLLFVGEGQINAQVPFETTAGVQPVIVRSAGAASGAFNLMVAAAAPGLFTHSGGAIVVRNENFSLITADNPAVAGDVLVLYTTGLGQTTPPLETGVLAPLSPLSLAGPLALSVGGRDAEVFAPAAAPNFLGLYQIAFRLPAGLSAGSHPVLVRMGSAQSNTAPIAVR